MNKIWITSDWHFCHDRKFVYEPRGFNDIGEMNETIIHNHNAIVSPEDDVYVLGDLMLGDNEQAKYYIEHLNGKIHIIRGNHCTNKRWNEIYPTISNVIELCGWSILIKSGKWSFYLCHFPTMVDNFEEKHKFYCLHGHTHDQNKFQFIKNCCYNVALDAHDNKPVSIEQIKTDLREIRED